MNARVRLMGLIVLLAGAAVTAGQAPAPIAPQPPAPPPQPTFKVRVDYVEVDAVVTDKQGRIVRDLTKEEFQVLEDGKSQAITTFTLVDIPVDQQSGTIGHCLQQRLHQHDIDHRRLVDDEEVAVERIVAVAFEAAGLGVDFEQPVDGLCLEAGRLSHPLGRAARGGAKQ